MPAGPLQQYRDLVADGSIERDPAQLSAAAALDALAVRVRRWRPPGKGVLSRLLLRPSPPPKGIYIHGAVGRGKTMLMDLFFQSVRFTPKRRIHFHEFMAEVHDRIAVARKSANGDTIPMVARAIAAEARLLCFDELHVTDIADAMILGRLFKGMFESGVVVVSTSNSSPQDLYKDGLNRQLFLPFIDMLERQMDVLELNAAKDFRLEKLAGRPLYFTPADAAAAAAMREAFTRLTGQPAGAPVDLLVKGHTVHVPEAAMGTALFSFADLCQKPLGAIDYLHIAHNFHTVLMEGIPVLARARRNEARRLINLIDTLYDNRVCLIVSAEAEPHELYPEGDGARIFERTASRLVEMRSEAYLLARPNRQSAIEAASSRS